MMRPLLTVLVFLAMPAAAGAAEPVRVADPGGGAAWSANTTQTRGAQTCAVVRRGASTRGRFCGRLDEGTPYLYSVRYETPPDVAQWRTVLVVVMSRNVTRAELETPDGPRRYRRGNRARVLLAVVTGKIEQPPLLVRVRIRGNVEFTRGGRAPAAEAADPGGAPSWRAVVERRTRRRACVAWERVPPRFGGPEARPDEGAFRCGNPALNLPALGVERVAGRLVVFGMVGPEVRGVVLRGPGEPGIAFERTSRSFVAVLPETANPADLTLVLALADGRDVERRLG
jgi:hypothetical protein